MAGAVDEADVAVDDGMDAVAVEQLECAGLQVCDGGWGRRLRWYVEVSGRGARSLVLVMVGVDVDVGGGCLLEGETAGFESLDDLCARACGDEDVIGKIGCYEEDRSVVGE